jgi:hypothetical protein
LLLVRLNFKQDGLRGMTPIGNAGTELAAIKPASPQPVHGNTRFLESPRMTSELHQRIREVGSKFRSPTSLETKGCHIETLARNGGVWIAEVTGLIPCL